MRIFYARSIDLSMSFHGIGPYNTIEILKSYQMWDGFFALAKLIEGKRSSATLTGVKRRQDGKDARRFKLLDGI